MNTMIIIALAVTIPIILFPAAFVWYLNLGAILKPKEKLIESKETA